MNKKAGFFVFFAVLAAIIAGLYLFLMKEEQSGGSINIIGAECAEDGDCLRTGCSGQLCLPRSSPPVFSTCEWRDEYGCYDQNACRCSGGKCQWQGGVAFEECLKAR